MSDDGSQPADDPFRLRKRALARWDNEGGAEPDGPQAASVSVEAEAPMPDNGAAEIASLHVRIIALENLLITLLATASDRQLELAGEMAAYIAPRPGFTHHALTTRAAAHMIDLVERASRFRDLEPS
ncbi:hypothetical protein [Phenylobacterium sp.]|uniref:hypothetical protein n=1 Tax=Phenylobacterium sp. TaxID=1871053 RepID=UPI0035647DAC